MLSRIIILLVYEVEKIKILITHESWTISFESTRNCQNQQINTWMLVTCICISILKWFKAKISYSMTEIQIVVCNIANSCENGDKHIYLTYIKVNLIEAEKMLNVIHMNIRNASTLTVRSHNSNMQISSYYTLLNVEILYATVWNRPNKFCWCNCKWKIELNIKKIKEWKEKRKKEIGNSITQIEVGQILLFWVSFAGIICTSKLFSKVILEIWNLFQLHTYHTQHRLRDTDTYRTHGFYSSSAFHSK